MSLRSCFFASLFFSAFALPACGSDESSLTLNLESPTIGAQGMRWSGRVVSDPPGIDCVLDKDGVERGHCAATFGRDGKDVIVTLTASGDEGSGLVAWTNDSSGDNLEGPVIFPGPSLDLIAKPGKDYAWTGAFGPKP